MDVPALFDLAEALRRLRCGRTFLLAHLTANPLHAGKPTHRRVGRRIMFTPDDFARLLETFTPAAAEPVEPAARGRAVAAPPSADRAYRVAMKAAERASNRRTGKKAAVTAVSKPRASTP
jgi:hypothetical protein